MKCQTCKGSGALYIQLRRMSVGGRPVTCADCHGSGQQEDNTGHPTAETPDAQPFDNVSESSRTPEQCYRCGCAPCKCGEDGDSETVNRLEVIDHTQTGTGRDFVKWEDFKFEVKLSYQDGGRTLKLFLIDSPEALPSNNASESDQSPSPSEQEDKPTKDVTIQLALALIRESADIAWEIEQNKKNGVDSRTVALAAAKSEGYNQAKAELRQSLKEL